MTTSVRDCVRCEATKADGRRCTRNTCIYPKYCWQHFRSLKRLKLAPSNIPEAGLGLFTTRSFQPLTTIAKYTGNIFSNEAWAESPSDYGVQYSNDTVLDARSTQSAIGRYVNECKAVDRLAGICRGNNALLRKTRLNNIIVESKVARIPANSEIFAKYGNDYWNNE